MSKLVCRNSPDWLVFNRKRAKKSDLEHPYKSFNKIQNKSKEKQLGLDQTNLSKH
jgi:uncharacterized protein YktA (UPF0223 family)